MLQAEFDFWPIVVLWILVVLLGRKKRPAHPPASSEKPAIEPPSAVMGELSRALQELKQAEDLARKKESARPVTGGASKAQAYLEHRKQQARGKVFLPQGKQPRPAKAKHPSVAFEDDDADKSSEAMDVEVRDYDEEADRIVQARRKLADRGERAQISLEELSPQQAARRGAVQEGRAIGGAAEHAEWHARQASEAQARGDTEEGPRRGRLARFADGSMRGALVLSEILGRPRGERS
ncbi:MAG: hypothetical protein HYR48_04925 [Gemmatimonadetes bacterium]|nr:hypothetical protein [Gemmatimonadota bacterium]